MKLSEQTARKIGERHLSNAESVKFFVEENAPIIAQEYEPVMECLREALECSPTHGIDCPAILKVGRYACDCWVSRAQKIVG